jgi:hypothetical protein
MCVCTCAHVHVCMHTCVYKYTHDACTFYIVHSSTVPHRIGSPVGGPHSLGEIRGAAAMKKTATGGEGAEASVSGRNKK